MTFKTILAAASGGTASDGAIELACRLAERFEAHVEGFHVRTDPIKIATMVADGLDMMLFGDWMDVITAEAATLAKKTRTAFEAAVARHDLPLGVAPPQTSASAFWREDIGYAPAAVSYRARFFDLAVLGRSDRVVEEPYTDTVEETLLHSGRPVLLAPAQAPEIVGDTIAIGWNGAPEAVRAITASLPLLRDARSVSIVTIGDEERTDVNSAVDYLGWHGISVKHDNLPRIPKVGAGEHLLAAARDGGADLLVMGGYGHQPWREFLFGGATREMLEASLLPLFMVH